MLKGISDEEWLKIIKNTKGDSILIRPEFLKLTAAVFQCRLGLRMYFYKDKPIIGFILFIQGKQIITPTYYLYSGIWMAESENSLLYRNCMAEAVRLLKNEYHSLQFRLVPGLKDCRPFLWENFKAEVRYTYLKDIRSLGYPYNVRSRIQKAKEAGVEIKQTTAFDAVWQQQEKDLVAYGFSKRSLHRLYTLFKAWHEQGYLYLLGAYQNDELLGSVCILVDKPQAKGSLLLISSEGRHYELGIHEALYHGVFQFLLSRECNQCDLVGANIRSIADFKSKFNPELSPYYQLTYTSGDDFRVWKGKMRQVVKSFLQSIS